MLQPRIGTRKLQCLLQQHHDIQVGRDKLFDLLRDHCLLVPTKRVYHKRLKAIITFAVIQIYLKPGQIKSYLRGQSSYGLRI